MPYLSTTIAEAIEAVAAAVTAGDQDEAGKILVDYAAEGGIKADSDRGRVPLWAWKCLRCGDGRMDGNGIAVWSSVPGRGLPEAPVLFRDIRFRQTDVDRLWPAPPLPDKPSLPDAIEFLARLIGERGGHERAYRLLIDASAVGRLVWRGMPETSGHNEVIPDWAWRKLKRDDGRAYIDGNGRDLTVHDNDPIYDRFGLYTYRWSDIYCDRRALEQLCAGNRISPEHRSAVMVSASEPPEPESPPIDDAEPRPVSAAVQVMRDAYTKLADERQITTVDTNKARHQKVRHSAEVRKHIDETGNDRGLSERTFQREVVKAAWPGKPEVHSRSR